MESGKKGRGGKRLKSGKKGKGSHRQEGKGRTVKGTPTGAGKKQREKRRDKQKQREKKKPKRCWSEEKPQTNTEEKKGVEEALQARRRGTGRVREKEEGQEQ